ncbi:MAG: 16S rRNA (guanine(966)-N(2))-methyltransferase RsmD [bacterium]
MGPARSRRGRGARGGVRPTVRRVRDALFNSLAARVQEAEVLDLFAGTGGLGLEALERGARSVVFVERDPRLAEGIRDRLRAAGLEARAEVWRASVAAALERLAEEGRRFDLILLDPPYGRGLLAEILETLAGAAVLAPGGRIVAEGHWRDAPRLPPALVLVREGRYGETALWECARRGGAV